ncbi:regulator of G-protein signaling 18 isoform 2-T2 [Pholidichthys leucotaenia]
MRKFNSEGSLFDLDFLPWKRVALKKEDHGNNCESGIYTSHNELDGTGTGLAPIVLESRGSPFEVDKNKIAREHSISAENLRKADKNHLKVCVISEGYRAYSDGQLVPAVQGSTESMETEETPSPSASFFTNPFCIKVSRSDRAKSRLSAVKLHLKSLFGQSPHSSNSSLAQTEQKDSAKERRSRLLFMHQWSQVGHSKKRKLNREELETWAESLNSLLASPTGVSVFGAFLRSEFSEENLQFYLACEEYRHSSNKFSLHRRAKHICTTYIQPGAPREVNLESKTRDLTIQLLQAPSHSSLSHAQKRIYSLLDTDCYPRFLQSTIYLSLLKDAD